MTHPRLLRHARKALAPLAGNGEHIQAAGHALVHYASDSVYTFIPKNGCSTMRLSLAIANGCLADPADFAWIHANNGTFRASLRDLVTAKYTFVILRCPFRRLASAYLDKIVERTDDYWALHRKHGDTVDPDTLSFRGFVALIAATPLAAANIHWRPQHSFLVYETYDDVFAMERFGEIPLRLKQKAGLELVDARRHTRHGTDGLDREAGAFADTPAHEILSMRRQGRVPDHAALYDPALTGEVARLYRDDLALYARLCDPEDLLFAID